jgi:hypothetical protein
MAVYKIFPEKDATLYTESGSMNTGLDQILEASTYMKLGDPYVSRYLIKFSTTEINDVFANKISSSVVYSICLRNYAAVVTGLSTDTELFIHPISGSWDMGTGHYLDSPIVTNGCSWVYQKSSGSTEWKTSSFGNFVTASFSGLSLNGGGTWYTGSNLGTSYTYLSSASFNYSDPIDINVNVTDIVKIWRSHSLDSGNGFANEGFIVKQSNANETSVSNDNSHIFKYFSIDTNTIYPPQLEFKWKDYIFNTGSSTLTQLTKAESFISIYNNVGVYYSESVARFRIAAIPKYPQRQFITASDYTTNNYLPENSSSYAIKDTETNEFIIDFDNVYTQLSADATSSYFDVYMNGLEPERYYTILLKTKLDGTTKVFDEDIMFKVAKG